MPQEKTSGDGQLAGVWYKGGRGGGEEGWKGGRGGGEEGRREGGEEGRRGGEVSY